MKKQLGWGALALSILALSLGELSAQDKGQDKSKDDPKARKAAEAAIKKAGRKLVTIVKALPKTPEDKKGELRDLANTQVRELELANHPLIADLYLDLGTTIEDRDIYENIANSLASMTSNEAVTEHLALRLKSRSDKKLRLIWQQRVMALDAIKSAKGAAAIAGTIAGLEDDEPPVRRAAIEIAGSKEDKAVIVALIKVLGELKDDGGLAYIRARQALVELTGQDFFTHEKWASWWDANKDSFDFGKKGEVKEARTVERKEEEIPRFFGTEVASNRCVFIIDVSGSMQMTDPPENWDKDIAEYEKLQPEEARQRITRARQALMKVVKTLQPTQLFNVYRYSSAVQPLEPKDALIPATPANKDRAQKFVETIKEGGGTETFIALKRAFDSVRDLDTIYLLSDGAPSPGKIGNPGDQQQQFEKEEIERLLSWIETNNRYRRIKIYTFGFDGPGAYHKKWGPRSVTLPTDPKYISHFGDFMRRLAAMTGGEYQSLK
jgi:hypothetical protein